MVALQINWRIIIIIMTIHLIVFEVFQSGPKWCRVQSFPQDISKYDINLVSFCW